MAWTEEMINDLKQMWKDGLTTNEIAKRLGVSKNSIVGKVHRLNLKARPSPIKKKEEVTTAETPVVKEEKEEKAKAASKKLKKVSITPVNIAKPKENVKIRLEYILLKGSHFYGRGMIYFILLKRTNTWLFHLIAAVFNCHRIEFSPLTI